MVKDSEFSMKLTEAVDRLYDAMKEEAAPLHQKGQALLTELSSSTSGKQPDDLKKSTSEDREKHHGETQLDSSENTVRLDSALDSVKRMRPDLTGEEIVEAACGLLG